MKNSSYLMDPPAVSNIQDCFEYIKKHELFVDNFPTQIHVNKIENKAKFKIKSRYYLEHLLQTL